MAKRLDCPRCGKEKSVRRYNVAIGYTPYRIFNQGRRTILKCEKCGYTLPETQGLRLKVPQERAGMKHMQKRKTPMALKKTSRLNQPCVENQQTMKTLHKIEEER